MSTRYEINKLGTTLFGKTRRAVLALLYSHPDESFYLRQLARMAGVGMGSLQRELKQLAEAGIIIRNEVGRQAFFKANPDCPLYSELKSLVHKTLGEIILKNEFCPKCYALRNMVMTSSTRVISDPDGKKKIIQTNLFHCDTCNSFLRSEEKAGKAG